MPVAATVLMCVYNERADFLHRAIDSIAQQTFTDFELLIVDDGSTCDRTLDVLSRWKEQDRRIRVLSTANRGLTRALNHGLAASTAEIVFRHDSDDWSADTRLSKQLAHLNSHPDCALVGSNYWLCDESGSPLFQCRTPQTSSGVAQALAGGRAAFCHGAVAFRRQIIRDLGGYRDSLPCAQDLDLFWRVSEIKETANLPEPLYYHRRSSGSVSVQKAHLQDVCACCARILAAMRATDGVEDFNSAWEQALTTVSTPDQTLASLFRKGDHLMIAGHHRAAAMTYLAGLRRCPTSAQAILKLFRLSIFATCPLARSVLFRARPN
jgi:glycosyltransferase involved in cell wall biosynthesis